MLERTYPDQICSVARALEVVGERWTLLIVRDCLLGIRRFEDFQAKLGLARSVLTSRLTRLVDEGLLERRRYQEHPERFEYVLTRKGRALAPVVIHLMKWGDSYYAPPEGPPRLTLHEGCGGKVNAELNCARCHERVPVKSLLIVAGPALKAAGSEADEKAKAKAGRPSRRTPKAKSL